MPQKVSLYVREHGSRKHVLANPKSVYPLGTIYVIRYVRDGKRTWETLTNCPTFHEAKVAVMRKETALLTKDSQDLNVWQKQYRDGKPAPAKAPEEVKPGELMLKAAIERYLENIQLKSAKTSSGYEYTMNQFFDSCGQKPLGSVAKQDLINFVGFMRRQELSDRTIHNRIVEVVTFLRHFGIKDITLSVKYTEKKVRAYRPDELTKIFAAADPEQWIMYQFFLCTGCREQEVMNAEYEDLDFVDGLFTVRAKAGWKPKDYEEREIPVADFLLEALKNRMLNTKGRLIFPTKDGKKDGHMLRRLQALAKRAGLVGEFGLHKFRKTYATLQHRAGVDARTIQKRLGHSDLATTLAYLEGEDARSERSRSQVNDTFGKFALSESK